MGGLSTSMIVGALIIAAAAAIARIGLPGTTATDDAVAVGEVEADEFDAELVPVAA
jgi:hypothetical protein